VSSGYSNQLTLAKGTSSRSVFSCPPSRLTPECPRVALHGMGWPPLWGTLSPTLASQSPNSKMAGTAQPMSWGRCQGVEAKRPGLARWGPGRSLPGSGLWGFLCRWGKVTSGN
jgi:hypothetical protein